jgi:GNAT superfamily N-acetyltransferase
MLLVGVWKQELAEVRTFYAECGYRGGVSSEDAIVATTKGNRIIGVVRLCPEGGVLVLRGMEVRLEHQRRGIGSLMLQELDKLIGKRGCWGIAPTHLEGFYGQIGFNFVDENTPEHLRARLRGYRARYSGLHRIMFRVPRPD